MQEAEPFTEALANGFISRFFDKRSRNKTPGKIGESVLFANRPRLHKALSSLLGDGTVRRTDDQARGDANLRFRHAAPSRNCDRNGNVYARYVDIRCCLTIRDRAYNV
jgi:hypothetical protein